MANTYKTTQTFAILIKALKKFATVILQGGQGSSKTTSILQYFIFCAISTRRDLILSIVGDSMPNLKANPIRIMNKLLKDMGIYKDFKVNETDKTYTHKKTGNVIEFFSVDTESSRLGARRSHLYLSECDSLKFDTYLALAGRSGVVIMDYNPKMEFWVHTELKGEDGIGFEIVTFEHNEYLPVNEVKMLLWYKKKAYHNPNFTDPRLLNAADNIKSKYYLNKWRVYGLGQLGVAEGLIFTEHEDWTTIKELPKDAKYIGAGLDFGFSHVSAIVKLYSWNDKVILKQSLFKKGMTAADLAAFIMKDAELLSSVVAADESRPEIITSLQNLGLPVTGARKGAGSVDLGLDIMKTKELLLTEDSEDMLKEFRAYAYATDKNGKSLGVPDKAKDVDNSIDAARYGFRYFFSLAYSTRFQLKRVS